jgi:hypothetical protein
MTNALAYDGPMAATLVQDPFNSELTVQDRCDRCGAQAYVRAIAGAWPSELLFCAHHGRKHVPALEDIEGIWVHDESDKLTESVAAQKQSTEA